MNTEQALEQIFRRLGDIELDVYSLKKAIDSRAKWIGLVEKRVDELTKIDREEPDVDQKDLQPNIAPEILDELIESLIHKCPSCGYEGHPIKSRTGELLCSECKKVYGSIGKTIPDELLEDLQSKVEEQPE